MLIEIPGPRETARPGMTGNDKMLFTSGHEEPRRILQKFIAAEINPFVDEWEKGDISSAHEQFKKLGDLLTDPNDPSA